LWAVASCGDSKSNPTAPSTPTATKVIALEGDLNFGDVVVGTMADRQFRIVNRGSATLNVSGLTGPSGFTASWTNGAIPSNQWQDVTVRFSPTAQQSYSGTMTVNGDQTSGGNTLSVSARGIRALFTRSGVGNTVFDAPTDMTRVRIRGTPSTSCQNFIVRVGGRLVVNDILGTCSVADARTYDGTHAVTGGLVEITNSTGIAWTFEEVR
jgi:hypothetical protein